MNKFLDTIPKLATAFAVGHTLTACASDNFDSLSVIVENGALIAEGVIDESTPKILREAIEANPDLTTIVLRYVPGSANDKANLEAARFVRASGMHTLVPTDGFIASGGTDLFLAGLTRTVEPGACIGVHSWAAISLFGNLTAGSDVPRDDPAHSLYLDYYKEMSIDPTFYWYTLEAAPVDAIHWVPTADIIRFGMSTTPIVPKPNEHLAFREICETRVDIICARMNC